MKSLEEKSHEKKQTFPFKKFNNNICSVIFVIQILENSLIRVYMQIWGITHAQKYKNSY
jgi:hypothetical protein